MEHSFEVIDFAHIFYPYYDFKRRTEAPTLAYVFKVRESSEEDPGLATLPHNVVAAVHPESGELKFWCGDNLLEGAVSGPQREERLAVMAYSSAVHADILEHIPETREEKRDCDFWKLYRDKKECRHVQYIRNLVEADPVGALALAELVEKVNSSGGRPTAKVTPPIVDALRLLVIPGAEKPRDEAEALQGEAGAPGPWYQTPEGTLEHLAFQSPVLLEGDKGAGKTTMARGLAQRREAVLVEVQGNESLEAGDLLGHFVPAQKDLVWKDGRLSQAFRLAGKGNKVVLLLDELLRIPGRQLSVLLAALSPFDDKYTLATGRMVAVEDGVGVEETLQCPVENLAVVATTNVGMQYAVDNIDPALADRFVPVRVATTAAKVRKALGEVCEAKGFTQGAADKLLMFFNKADELYASRNITEPPSQRVLIRCVECVANEEDIGPMLRIHFPLWVARTSNGQPDPQQVALLGGVLTRIFGE